MGLIYAYEITVFQAFLKRNSVENVQLVVVIVVFWFANLKK